MKITTRQIALTGILLAISAILINTPLGMIPVPTPAQYATIMHIPVIIVGIMEGPLVGAIAGLLFGLLAFLKVPAFGPFVHLLPRPFIGIISGLVYMGISYILKNRKDSIKETIAVSLSAILGSLVNTLGVLGTAVWLVPQLMPISVAMTIGLTAGIPEAIFAVIFSLPIVMAIKNRFPYLYQQKRAEVRG